jgi:hypothetical protein
VTRNRRFGTRIGISAGHSQSQRFPIVLNPKVAGQKWGIFVKVNCWESQKTNPVPLETNGSPPKNPSPYPTQYKPSFENKPFSFTLLPVKMVTQGILGRLKVTATSNLKDT